MSNIRKDDYAKFFALLEDIVDDEGTSSEKKEALLEAAKEYGDSAVMNLEELAAWID